MVWVVLWAVVVLNLNFLTKYSFTIEISDKDKCTNNRQIVEKHLVADNRSMARKKKNAP